MPTVVKTFAFASDAEGLADAAVSGVAFSFLSTDGNPSGCIRFTQANKSVTQTEFARRSTTGQTWETWGVPAGATVTNVQVTAWQEKLTANTKLSSHSLKARVIGSGGATVHSAGDLLDAALGVTVDAAWATAAAGTSRAVNAGSQASATDVRLELEYTVTTSGGGGAASVEQRFDQIALTITYSLDVSGAAALGGTGSVAAAGTVTGIISGAAALVGSGAVAARAALTVAARSALGGVGAVAARASQTIAGRFSGNGTGSVTASGSVGSGSGDDYTNDLPMIYED